MPDELQAAALHEVVGILRSHESELRRPGLAHAAVFGSVARGEGTGQSDIDLLVDIDYDKGIGIFEYSRLKLYLNDILPAPADVANRRTLKPLLKESIARDAVFAF